MPNKKGKNAFYLFMLDWKKRAEARGEKFPNGLKDIQADENCSREWNSLTAQQKAVYVSKAKDNKANALRSMDRQTTHGECTQELRLQQEKKQELEEKMREHIEFVVSMGVEQNNVEKLKFCFIHMNWFCIKQIGINTYEYFPAEFAVAVFSIEKGIEDMYHEIVNIKIPLGYTREAIETSQQSHQIPIELSEGEHDFAVMYTKLRNFLKPQMTGNKFPPLFTSTNLLPAVQSLLDRMTKEAKRSEDKFLIYKVEALFSTLRHYILKQVNMPGIPHVVAKTVFDKDVFCYYKGLECVFHQNLDGTGRYCSMSVVKRWGFTICDYCCEHLGIPIIHGVHLPALVPDDIDLDKSMDYLSLNNNTKIESFVSGSDKVHQDSRYRRNTREPMEAIDYNKIGTRFDESTVNTSSVCERPLRPPKTQPLAMLKARDHSPDLDEFNFSAIGGRGMFCKKKLNTAEFLASKGHGSG